MTSYYSNKAILLATFENVLVGKKEIFLQKDGLTCEITKNFTQIKGETIISSGLYTFSYMENGKQKSANARYSYVIINDKIVNHHSSVAPE